MAIVRNHVKSIVHLTTEMTNGKHVPVDGNLISWIVPYVGFVRNRFKQGTDGTTPYQRINGSEYNGFVVNFGEQVMVKRFKNRAEKSLGS